MILSRLNDYLRLRRRASLVDMAHGLGATPDAVRGMLATLERKGRVRRLVAGAACAGCGKCDAAALELYEWAGD
jgi:predicted ArsR family transcriptional regulator